MIIFVAIMVYVVYCVFASLQVEHISPYEVKEGSDDSADKSDKLAGILNHKL